MKGVSIVGTATAFHPGQSRTKNFAFSKYHDKLLLFLFHEKEEERLISKLLFIAAIMQVIGGTN